MIALIADGVKLSDESQQTDGKVFIEFIRRLPSAQQLIVFWSSTHFSQQLILRFVKYQRRKMI